MNEQQNETALVPKVNLQRLKIKYMSLAAESRIIKNQEKKLLDRMRKDRLRVRLSNSELSETQKARIIKKLAKLGDATAKAKATSSFYTTQNQLQWADNRSHRQDVVQVEARVTNLAYGFLKGRAYQEIERSTHRWPPILDVEPVAKRFADEDWRVVGQRYQAWLDAAKAYVKPTSWEEYRK